MRTKALPGQREAAASPGAPAEGGRSAIATSRGTSGGGADSLAERLHRRDHAALEELYDACAGRAYGLAFRMLNDGPAAEDAVHDAFLWFWEHADRIDGARGKAEALLLTITHRRAIDQIRRRQRQDGRGSAALRLLDPVDEAALDILERSENAGMAERVRTELANLNQQQREALELAYFDGLTQEEIARRQRLPLGTVKSRMRLGLNKLRSALRSEASP